MLKEHERQLDEQDKEKEERKQARAAAKKTKDTPKQQVQQKAKRRKEDGGEEGDGGRNSGGERNLNSKIRLFFALLSKSTKTTVRFANRAGKSSFATRALVPTIWCVLIPIWKSRRRVFGRVRIANRMECQNRGQKAPKQTPHRATWRHAECAMSVHSPSIKQSMKIYVFPS